MLLVPGKAQATGPDTLGEPIPAFPLACPGSGPFCQETGPNAKGAVPKKLKGIPSFLSIKGFAVEKSPILSPEIKDLMRFLVKINGILTEKIVLRLSF
jgi:hypothetical protein